MAICCGKASYLIQRLIQAVRLSAEVMSMKEERIGNVRRLIRHNQAYEKPQGHCKPGNVWFFDYLSIDIRIYIY